MMRAVPHTKKLMSALPPKAPKAILLIDDDDLIAGSLRQVLASSGCDVDVALEPCTARTLMAKRAYDVVLVDPYLTGGVHQQSGELLEAIGTLQPHAAVIVLTGYDSELLHTAADGRVSKILTKPQPITFLSQFISGATAPLQTPTIKG
jgi:DNA-binding NtrC family response regulator